MKPALSLAVGSTQPHRSQAPLAWIGDRAPLPSRAAEQRLSGSMRQFASFVSTAPTAIALFGLEIRYLAVSEPWLQRFGAKLEDLIGRLHDDALGELPERYRDAHRRALGGEVVRSERDCFVTASGTLHMHGWVCAPCRDEHGVIQGVTVAIHDVTEQERLEERVRVSDRMASIGMLGAGLGHDMQNVLLPLRAHLNALRAVGRAAGVRGQEIHIDSLKRGVDYLQHLADSLHTLACEDPRATDGEPAATSLDAWWTEVEPLFHCALPKRTRMSVAFERGLGPVCVPPHQLTRAVLNLLTNASRAVKARLHDLSKGGHIVVTAERVVGADRGWVRLSVADNGVGMSNEVRNRATEAFFTTKCGGKGMGLGLALVSRVLQDCGGALEIQSEQGVGTTMSMVLPTRA